MNCIHENPCSDRDPETCKNTKCPANRAVHRSSPSACSVTPVRNPVRGLNEALHEYRTKHTTMDKDEFYDSGCYSAFMWAWQHSSVTQNADLDRQGEA